MSRRTSRRIRHSTPLKKWLLSIIVRSTLPRQLSQRKLSFGPYQVQRIPGKPLLAWKCNSMRIKSINSMIIRCRSKEFYIRIWYTLATKTCKRMRWSTKRPRTRSWRSRTQSTSKRSRLHPPMKGSSSIKSNCRSISSIISACLSQYCLRQISLTRLLEQGICLCSRITRKLCCLASCKI